MNAADAALMNTITPSLTPKVSRMSGASTASVAPSKFSTRHQGEEHVEGERAARGAALRGG